jgi:hypothetical protein
MWQAQKNNMLFDSGNTSEIFATEWTHQLWTDVLATEGHENSEMLCLTNEAGMLFRVDFFILATELWTLFFQRKYLLCLLKANPIETERHTLPAVTGEKKTYMPCVLRADLLKRFLPQTGHVNSGLGICGE